MAEEKQSSPPEQTAEVISVTKRVRGEDFVRFYANNIQVGFTSWDMRITFGEVVENSDTSQLRVEERTTIVMSLHHAKAAINVLMDQLTALEKQFGEIKILQQPVS